MFHYNVYFYLAYAFHLNNNDNLGLVLRCFTSPQHTTTSTPLKKNTPKPFLFNCSESDGKSILHKPNIQKHGLGTGNEPELVFDGD